MLSISASTFALRCIYRCSVLENELVIMLNLGHFCRIKDVCDGQKQIPFMKENESGKWLYDSDKMVPYLEDKYPNKKKLGKPDECPQV